MEGAGLSTPGCQSLHMNPFPLGVNTAPLYCPHKLLKQRSASPDGSENNLQLIHRLMDRLGQRWVCGGLGRPHVA